MSSQLAFGRQALHCLQRSLTSCCSLHRCSSKSRAWRTIDHESAPQSDSATQFWWNTVGRQLSLLLAAANYSTESQEDHLRYFRNEVTPCLGSRQPSGKTRNLCRWYSSVTDSGDPIELKWDWGLSSEPPVLGYAFEPFFPGTEVGSVNAGLTVLQTLVRQGFPIKYLDLMNHMRTACTTSQVDRSQFFLDFELRDLTMNITALIIPLMRAHEAQTSTIRLISDALRTFPQFQEKTFAGLEVLEQYIDDGGDLSVGMISVDCMAPTEARVQVHARSDAITFESVRHTVTLGGQLAGPEIESYLSALHALWKDVFEQPRKHENTSASQRIAGVLYKFDISPGQDSSPAKVYLPVRHYAQNEDEIAAAVTGTVKQHRLPQSNVFIGEYMACLRSMVEPGEIGNHQGAQTYIGCSFEQGSLRTVSHISPQTWKYI